MSVWLNTSTGFLALTTGSGGGFTLLVFYFSIIVIGVSSSLNNRYNYLLLANLIELEAKTYSFTVWLLG